MRDHGDLVCSSISSVVGSPRGHVQDSLDRLLSVQNKGEHCAHQLFNLRRGWRLGDSLLNILRTEVGQLWWEGMAEARSEHDQELSIVN